MIRKRHATTPVPGPSPLAGEGEDGGGGCVIALLCLPLLLLPGCEPSGDRVGDVSVPTEPGAQVEQQAIENLLELYREAIVNEDIDRLQALLSPDASGAVMQTRTAASAFRQRTVLAHVLQEETIAEDRQSATFIEVQSSLDPEHLVQQSEVFRTTPEGGSIASLDIVDQQASGSFIAQSGTGLHGLPIQARSIEGDVLTFDHHYRLHQTQAGIAQRVSGTGTTRFFTVTVTTNGTGWAGGDGGATLYQIAPGAGSAQPVGSLLEDPSGRVQDLAIDSLGRLHAVMFSPQNSGTIVFDEGVFCQTVNANAPDYPFTVLDLADNTIKPSASTRLLPAPDGNVWLFGSDGGVAQVSDSFRQGQCPDNGIIVSYDPIYQRQSSDLPTNTVPAFITTPDGALWFGTALGLVHVQNGVFTPVPFQDSPTLPDDIETLEGLFQAIADAIFAAMPLDTLHVVDIAQDTEPRFLSSVALPIQDPTGLAMAGGAVYIGARAAGLLVFDVHEPSAPRRVGSVGDPNPPDTLAVSVVAGPLVVGQFAYLLETQRDLQTGRVTEHFVVLDVRNPLAPVRRGTVPLRGVTRASVLTTAGTRMAVAGSFAYVTRGALGLQAVDIRQPDAPRPVGVITTPSCFTLSVVAVDQVLYVTDAIFGLQVIQAPGPNEPDTDGDRVGDNADPDADNDGFTNAKEAAATPPTDAFDPRLYPVAAPPPEATTLIVDAASPAPVRARNGTPEAPYRSPTEALQVLHSGQAPQVHTLFLRTGLYAPATTQDVFPLDLSGLAHLTLRGEDRATTVLDAEFRNSVVVAAGSQDLVFEDLTITHGWLGLAVFLSQDIVIRRIDSTDHNRHGLVVAATTGAVLEDNLVTSSRAISGIGVAGGAEVVMTRNVSRAHPLHGILVFTGSRADMRDNVFEDNGLSGIVIDLNATVTLTNNLTQGNALDGLTVSRNAHATLTDIVSQNNGRDGIAIVDTAAATIHGGISTQNGGDGIRVGGGTLLPGRSTATLGLDDAALVEVSRNDGAGLLVVDDGFGSQATIDSRNIAFDGNTDGDLLGDICDVAVEACP